MIIIMMIVYDRLTTIFMLVLTTTLYAFMNSARPDFHNYSLIGKVLSNTSPIRDPGSKWFLSEATFPGEIFPPYLTGLGYALTGNLINPIYTCALR